jgi:hypothetical protein
MGLQHAERAYYYVAGIVPMPLLNPCNGIALPFEATFLG